MPSWSGWGEDTASVERRPCALTPVFGQLTIGPINSCWWPPTYLLQKIWRYVKDLWNRFMKDSDPPARSCFLTLTLLSLRFSWKVKHCAMKLMCSSHSVGKTMNEMKTDETSWQQSWLSSQNSISIIVMTMSTIIIINTILLFISSSQATGLATSSAECEIILI